MGNMGFMIRTALEGALKNTTSEDLCTEIAKVIVKIKGEDAIRLGSQLLAAVVVERKGLGKSHIPVLSDKIVDSIGSPYENDCGGRLWMKK
jgi:hypothetical protein